MPAGTEVRPAPAARATPQPGARPLLYGGQAIIEGVMMRGPEHVATAVRTPAGEVVVRSEARPSVLRRAAWLRLPLVRGLAVLGESLAIGLKALLYSAEQAAPEDQQISRAQLNLTMVAAIVFAVGLFFVVPTWLASLLRGRLAGAVALNLVEGGLRAAILIGYLAAVARMTEIQRVLAYHGAEHKAIHALEHGQELTVANARLHPRFHPRCGTSFLLFVVLVSIVLFAFFGWPALWVRVALRVVLLPLLAGLGYEALRASARLGGALAAPVVAPGLWLQRLTTREPDDDQLEVALAALRAVFAGEVV